MVSFKPHQRAHIVRPTAVGSWSRGCGADGPPLVDGGPLLKPNEGKETPAQRYTAKCVKLIKQMHATDSTSWRTELIGDEIGESSEFVAPFGAPKLFAKRTCPANRSTMHFNAIGMVIGELEENTDFLGYMADILLRWASFCVDDAEKLLTVLIRPGAFVKNL